MAPPGPPVYRFGDFTLDLEGHRLLDSGREVPLQPKAFETLRCLIERHGRLVTKRELHDRVWGDVAVTDGALGRCIVEVRKALGDGVAQPRFLQTVPRLGYRFVGRVEAMGPSSGARAAATADAPVRCLVVLPFVNLSRDPEQEYFVDGFTDLLIAELGRVAGLNVISRTSAMCYRATTRSLPEIARELGVDVAAEGSILRAGDRVRITVQLIDARSDTHLWADSYERDLHDILRLQREVARDVAAAIRVALTPTDWQNLDTIRPVTAEAHEAYLKACYFWHKRTADDIARSVEYYHRAIARDSRCARAYAGLALASGVAGFYGYVPPSQAFAQMKADATTALALEPSLAEAHACLAAVFLFHDWDWQAASDRFRRALDENPSHPVAHEWYGWCLLTLGRTEEALAEIRRARELDPLSVRAHVAVSMSLYFARQYERAIEYLDLALELDPRFPDVHCSLGLNCLELARWERALAEFHEAVELSGRSAEQMASLGFAFGRTGRTGDAHAVLADLEARAAQRYVPAVYFAAVHAGLGDTDGACEWLDRAFAERSSWLVFLRVEPWWDGLRTHPRFMQLVERMRL
jgi:TolB-like protein/Flp pilus assembly protein TadD